MDLHKKGAQVGAIRFTAEDEVCWFRDIVESHATPRLWTAFALDDIPSYLAMRFGVRSGDCLFRLAGRREFAPFSLEPAQIICRYQRLAINHLSVPAVSYELSVGTSGRKHYDSRRTRSSRCVAHHWQGALDRGRGVGDETLCGSPWQVYRREGAQEMDDDLF